MLQSGSRRRPGRTGRCAVVISSWLLSQNCRNLHPTEISNVIFNISTDWCPSQEKANQRWVTKVVTYTESGTWEEPCACERRKGISHRRHSPRGCPHPSWWRWGYYNNNNNNNIHIRHSQLNDLLWRAVKKAQIPASKEPIGLSRADGKRPDGATLVPWTRGKPLAWDVTVPDTFAASHLQLASTTACAAAENGSR